MKHLDKKALEWQFTGHENTYVICNYITHEHADNVIQSFKDLENAEAYMNENDLWDDYYIYYIKSDSFAYAPEF